MCWPAAHCSDSLVSVESASESASSGCSSASVAGGDEGIFMGFHNAMIMTKHRHFEFLFTFAPT